MGRSDAGSLTLINAALPDECAHVAVAVNVKYFQINIAVGGLEVTGTFFCINFGCGCTAGQQHSPKEKD